MTAEDISALPAAIAPLNTHAVVEVAGDDAAALLQGQLSNDIQALAANPGQLATLNSPKGRVLAFLRVLRHDSAYWLIVDRDVVDAFVQRLRMFVLRSKVTIRVRDDIAGAVLLGRAADHVLTKAGLAVPGDGETLQQAGCLFMHIPGPAPRIEIYGTTLPALDAATAQPDDLARWDVLFHLPRINDANRDQHIVQHLGLDELGAVNFRKGCYTGQEIIARMKYLGKVKKRAFVLIGQGAKPGDSVRDANERAVGEIVNVAPAADQQLLLASVNIDAIDATLFINGTAARKVDVS